MKFDINDYKGKYAMHCKTEEEANDFCKYMDSIGRRWCTYESYIKNTCYYKYMENTVYTFNEGSYSDMKWHIEHGYTILEWSDFMSKEFTKADLKTGDVVKFENGNIGIVNGELRTIVMKDVFCQLKSYNENLTCKHTDALNSWDIVAVRRPHTPYDCQFCAFEKKHGVLVYERKEVEEMTLEQVCKLLGKEIKIVKG